MFLVPDAKQIPFPSQMAGYAYMPTSSPPVPHRFPFPSVFDGRHLLTWTLSGLFSTSRLTFLSLSMSQISNYLEKLFGCLTKQTSLAYLLILTGHWHKKDFPFFSDSEVRDMLIWRCCFGVHSWADFSITVLYVLLHGNFHVKYPFFEGRVLLTYSFYALGSSRFSFLSLPFKVSVHIIEEDFWVSGAKHTLLYVSVLEIVIIHNWRHIWESCSSRFHFFSVLYGGCSLIWYIVVFLPVNAF